MHIQFWKESGHRLLAVHKNKNKNIIYDVYYSVANNFEVQLELVDLTAVSTR